MNAYHVLLVEDDEDHAILMEKQLSRIALVGDVVRAADGVEALRLLSNSTYHPDIVLLDLNLPKFSGHEVLQSMRSSEATRTTPVIVVTSSSHEDDAERAWDHDVKDVVIKPATSERLAEIMRKTFVVESPASGGEPGGAHD